MNNLNKRFHIIKIFVIVSAIVIASRFFYIQIIKHSYLSNYAKKEYRRKTKEIMPRGNIYDINGNILASSIVKWDVVIMKKDFEYNKKNITSISSILNIPSRELESKIKNGKNYVKIKKYVEKDVYDKIKELKIRGVLLEAHQSREYPASVAREIIGMSNENKGLSNLELTYDKYLRGNIVSEDQIRDSRGNVIKVIEQATNDEPYDIYLTVDERIQSIVEQVAADYYNKLDPEKIIILVEDVKSGNISAMASYPPNYINLTPIEYVYEPGSTFKTVILSAGFNENIIKETDVFNCENGRWQINNRQAITDHEPLGNTVLRDVYAHSSNIGFAKVGLKIGIEKLYPYIKKFGFGSRYTDFRGESGGIVKDFKRYRDVDIITTSYGYGIAVTPLQLINAYTAIANRGVLIKPNLIYKMKRGEEEIGLSKREVIREVITENTAKRVTDMMINVVENGTGIAAQIPGYYIAGKTGTANKLNLKTGKYVKGANVTSFCGFFPATDPQYSMLIIVDNSKKYKFGSQTAAPIFSKIASYIISIKNIKKDRAIDYSKINAPKKQEVMAN
ncbi:MAG: penicillin-binding protein 2 [Elusimicrobiales bacterium]|nr:penicillin-binding protein 2 [Elusimicrobiales bacterium]